jgi:polysaccharide biosynthesis protein PslG
MKRLIVAAALAVALVSAAYAFAKQHHRVSHHATAVPLPAGVAGPRLFGFNDNSSLMEQTSAEAALQRSADAGANVVRYTVNWDYVEQTRGQYDWRSYDQLYAAALRRNVHPILVAAFSPGWARPLDLSCGTASAHCHDPPDSRHDADWGRFVAALAERYPKAAAIEVWNEPNLIDFWRSGPSAARYAALTQIAYDAVKSKAPDMPVLAGALNNTQNDGIGTVGFAKYLTAYLAAKPPFDALSLHDYDLGGASPTWFDDTLAIARSELADAGLAKPIWITEMGVTTTGPDAIAPQAQAARLVAELTDLGRQPDVRAAVVHTLVPTPGDPTARDYGFAVMNADGTPKPAYCALALARHVAAPRGCPRPVVARTARTRRRGS